MADTFIQKASLAGQVIEDLSDEPLEPERFHVELEGENKLSFKKPGGFFVFSDLTGGDFTLNISGTQMQSLEHQITIPLPELMISQPGDNELIVVVNSISNGNNGINRIIFDQVILKKKIRAGAAVIGNGFSTTLETALDIGRITQARLTDASGVAAGDIVRIVRDRSIRLKFDPYSPEPSGVTRIVGKVISDTSALPLEDVQVKLVEVNNIPVAVNEVKGPEETTGAQIAAIDMGGTVIILGTEKDIVTYTNKKGDYNLYFRRADFPASVTLRAEVNGYTPQDISQNINSGLRNTINFSLVQI